MARLKDFLYWLLNEEGKPLTGDLNSLAVSENDYNTLVDDSGSITFLKKTPDGWRDVLVKFARNNKYWGLFRDFTVPMKFVKDGALIVKDAFWKKGVEAYTKLLIHKADRSIFPIRYKTWYTGELDYSNFLQDRAVATVNVMEGGVSKYLKANENTVYEIPVNGDIVKIEGVRLFEKQNYFVPAINYSGARLLMCFRTTAEGRAAGSAFFDQNLGEMPTSDYDDTTNYLFTVSQDIVGMRFTGNFKFLVESSGVPSALFLHTSTDRDIALFNVTAVTNGQEFDIDVDVTFDALANEKFYLSIFYPSVGIFRVQISETTFSIHADSIYKPTFVKTMKAFDLFAAIVSKMTNGLFQAKSDFLTQLDGYVFTSGNAIRGFENSVIKTSLADFYKSMTSIFSVGIGIEGEKIALELLPHFFSETTTINLGIVNELNVSVSQDLIYNRIKAGYKPIDYENVNGRSEFNTEQLFSIPYTRIAKELDIQSVYRADPYGIEFTRINFEGLTTTDSQGDNDTFVLNIEANTTTDDDGTYHKLNRPSGLIISGVPDPDSIFNVLLSPHRCIKNNGRLIRSFCHHMDDKKIVFSSGDKNVLLSVDDGTDTLVENQDFIIGQLGERLFLPYMFSFKTEVPVNIQDIIKTNPYDRIAFTWKGVEYYGYLWDGGVQPATNDVQEWKLLAATNNDLTKLIAA